MPTNGTHFSPFTRKPWNHNWLDGGLDFLAALFDLQTYNMFVDAVNERVIAQICLADTNSVVSPGDPRLFPHAVRGDYLCGFNPLGSPTNAANTTPNTNVGWHLLMNYISTLWNGGVGYVWTARSFDPTSPTNGLSSGGTSAASYVDPGWWGAGVPFSRGNINDGSNHSNLDCILAHPMPFCVPHRVPLEITDWTNTAAVGQVARMVGSSATYGQATGHLFKMGTNTAVTGGWYLHDAGGTNGQMYPTGPAAGLPDVMEYIGSYPTGLANMGIIDDTRLRGERIDAYFLSRLRDRINLTARFFTTAEQGAGPPANSFYISAANNYGNSGYGTGTTVALANAAAAADYGGGTNVTSGPGFALDIGAGWFSDLNPHGYYEVTASLFTRDLDASNGTNSNFLPNNKQFAIEVFYGHEFYNARVPFGGTFYGFGENVFDTTTAVAPNLDKVAFIYNTGTISASATNFTSAWVTGTGYPDGYPSGGTDRVGFQSALGFDSEPIRFWCTAYDVPGGFKYTKDYAGF